MQQYMLGADRLENSFAKKNLGNLVDKVTTSLHCGLVAKMANNILGCIRKNIASMSSKVIAPLCSALMTPCLECWVQR